MRNTNLPAVMYNHTPYVIEPDNYNVLSFNNKWNNLIDDIMYGVYMVIVALSVLEAILKLVRSLVKDNLEFHERHQLNQYVVLIKRVSFILKGHTYRLEECKLGRRRIREIEIN